MPSLPNFRKCLPEESREDAILCHISGSYCAMSLAEGKKRKHSHNGTIAAIDSPVTINSPVTDDASPHHKIPKIPKVYLTCTTGTHRITQIKSKAAQIVNMHSKSLGGGGVEPVSAVTGKCIHWVMLTPENIKEVMAEGQLFVCSYSLHTSYIHFRYGYLITHFMLNMLIIEIEIERITA